MNSVHKHRLDPFLILLVDLLYFVQCFELSQVTEVVHHLYLLEVVLPDGLNVFNVFQMIQFVQHHRLGLQIHRWNVVSVLRNVCGFQTYDEIKDLESTFQERDEPFGFSLLVLETDHVD